MFSTTTSMQGRINITCQYPIAPSPDTTPVLSVTQSSKTEIINTQKVDLTCQNNTDELGRINITCRYPNAPSPDTTPTTSYTESSSTETYTQKVIFTYQNNTDELDVGLLGGLISCIIVIIVLIIVIIYIVIRQHQKEKLYNQQSTVLPPSDTEYSGVYLTPTGP
ncbi:hypothetical protein LOTGIDRAFT_169904 [Lottia gigantea]|uniref:Uncharacterized protein n=1 Tax=Lottia gigantea TaxID=225164 RepID=V3YWZ6_LOTGI|nr:hypothetical protein LOTGIDRAFT_169904 [Lottia gigantea]ESO82583.1 hypothetical protein LOTGIDRAFT_169904 [Lottia gigantea]